MEIKNHTQFTVQHWLSLTKKGARLGNILIKGQFSIHVNAAGEATLSKVPCSPILAQDLFYTAPNISSVYAESDFTALKPTTDIIANATAYAPHGEPSSTWQAGIQVQNDPTAWLTVYGPRYWERALWVPMFSEPEPCLHVPIRYENAFGGYHQATEAVSPFNPIGKGFLPKGAKVTGTPVHQIEWTDQPIDEEQARNPQPPAGFGTLHRSWQPRLALAGTFDNEWLAKHHPLLPLDYDPKHTLAGCERLRPKQYLTGGESLTFYQLDPVFPQVTLKVPHFRMMWGITLATGKLKGAGQCHLDTIHLDIEKGIDNGLLTLTWRGEFPAQTLPVMVRAVELPSSPKEAVNG